MLLNSGRKVVFSFNIYRLLYIPEIIIGDLDSVRNEVREFYEKQGTTVMRISSQDNTDFEKTMIYINQREKERGNHDF
jgi:thiamine pyrophosphokinase